MTNLLMFQTKTTRAMVWINAKSLLLSSDVLTFRTMPGLYQRTGTGVVWWKLRHDKQTLPLVSGFVFSCFFSYFILLLIRVPNVHF
jgi:hypothetical protein